MIEVKNLSKYYGEKCVFRNLNLTIPVGIITAFTGASGIGKTTLLRIIAGLEPPSEGCVTGLEGMSATYVFQENRLIEPLSVLKNVLAVGADKDKAVKLLTEAGLENELHTKASVLSGGMKRRLAIVRALAKGGDFYYLDEPLRELDEPTAAKMLSLMQTELQGKTGILISHDPSQVELLAHNPVAFEDSPMRVGISR